MFSTPLQSRFSFVCPYSYGQIRGPHGEPARPTVYIRKDEASQNHSDRCFRSPESHPDTSSQLPSIMFEPMVPLVLLHGFAAAIPAPTPVPTSNIINKRQDVVTATDNLSCSMTYEEAHTLFIPVPTVGDDGEVATSTQTVPISAGEQCYCDGGAGAGASSSTGNDGRTTLYCAAGDASTRAPQATLSPESDPGSANNGACMFRHPAPSPHGYQDVCEADWLTCSRRGRCDMRSVVPTTLGNNGTIVEQPPHGTL